MGLAKLSRVTVIAPRTDYAEVTRALAQFEEFHPFEGREQNFDPAVEELTVKAVRLFAQADQAVKDLAIQLSPGTIDIVFRGVKIPRSDFEVDDWEDLLNKAENQLNPMVDEIKTEKATLQKVIKEETDAGTLRDALQVVSDISANLSSLPRLHRLELELVVVPSGTVQEFQASLTDAIFLTQPLSQTHSLVLVALQKSEGGRLEKTMKTLELKPLTIPGNLRRTPQKRIRGLALTTRTPRRRGRNQRPGSRR